MLDFFAIFGRGGALLWSHRFTALRHDPTEALNSLIRDCLLEERSGETTFTYTPKAGAQQAMKWTFHNVSTGQQPFDMFSQFEAVCSSPRAPARRPCYRALTETIFRSEARPSEGLTLVCASLPHACGNLDSAEPQGMGLVFVAMYQKTLSLMYVDELLQQVKATFCSDAWFKPDGYDYKGFDATFNKLLRECEGRADDAKRSVAMKAPSAPPPKPATSSGTRAAASGGKGAVAAAAARRGGAEESGDDSAVAGGSEDGAVSDAAPSSKQAPTDTDGGMTSDAAGATDSERENNAAAASAPLSSSPNAGGFDLSKLSKLAGKGGARGGAKASGPLASSSRSAANSVDSKSKKVKRGGGWCWAGEQEQAASARAWRQFSVSLLLAAPCCFLKMFSRLTTVLPNLVVVPGPNSFLRQPHCHQRAAHRAGVGEGRRQQRQEGAKLGHVRPRRRDAAQQAGLQ